MKTSDDTGTPGRARLQRIHVRGFRSLVDVTLEPGDVGVMIGPNGSGKSNLMQFLRMMSMLRTHSLGLFVSRSGGASSLLHIGPQRARSIECELEFDVGAGTSRYAAAWEATAGDRLVFTREELAFRATGKRDWKRKDLGAGHHESNVKDVAHSTRDSTARHFNWCLKGLSFFHFHDTSAASPLRGNARIADGTYVRSDGSNLAAYLYALQKSTDGDDAVTWRNVTALLRQVAPFLKELQPGPVSDAGTPQVRETSDQSFVRLYWLDDRDERFGPEHLSDGTLRLIALIAALTQPAHRLPRFLSIDEPELGLHPAALALVAELVRTAGSQSQVLLATQSPALLNLFAPEDVIVCERDDGATTLRRLDTADLSAWLVKYSLAELFDKGVLGGRP